MMRFSRRLDSPDFVIFAFLIVAGLLAGCRSGGMPATTSAPETAAATAATPAATPSATPVATPSATPAATPPATPASGYDLYSWEAGGAQRFSLLEGANRLRSFDEIQNAEVTVEGVAALKSKLRKLPPGAKVRWSARVVNTEMPSKEVVDDVSRFCAQVGLDLTVTE